VSFFCFINSHFVNSQTSNRVFEYEKVSKSLDFGGADKSWESNYFCCI